MPLQVNTAGLEMWPQFQECLKKAHGDILEMTSQASTMGLEKCALEPNMVSHTYGPSMWKAEAQGL